MQRVMAVEELLDTILNESTRETKARCARACKSWSNTALDSLWRSMDSTEPIFSLLSPLTRDRPQGKTHELKFANKVRAKDWTRLNTYASRIKHLRLRSCVREGGIHFVYSSSVLLEVAHKRRTLSLLPALTDLEVAASLDKSLLEFVSLLVGENLQRLAIYMPHDDALIESLFEELVDRTTGLIELRLWLPTHYEMDSLTTFLRAQTKLRTVGFSLNAFQSNLITLLTEHPLLEEIETLSNDDGILVLPLDEACTFLVVGCSPPHLTSLSICSPQFETAETLYSFLLRASKACPGLLELRVDDVLEIIDSPSLGDILRPTEEGGIDFVTINILEPLYDLSLLRVFTLSYHRMLHISNTDLDSLVRGWPHLVELSLSFKPTRIGDIPLLTLHALPIVARHCPQLRHLALYVNCTGAIPSPEEALLGEEPTSLTQQQFSNLRILEFGLSPIGDAQTVAVAEYLCRIAPPFTFRTKQSWHSLVNAAPLERGHAALFESFRQLWSEVWKLVPIMKNLMEREQVRLVEARREIYRLKARVEALENQVAKYV
ncbi:hypothetical protein EW145_g7025 [Phellinidium pouzarii]|uniref:F-box domain-containing protein n=1 Tax=Phellinidium pouzarii TaxID=167371 RepID=A0A4S4KQF6_9AGAM|nr:hypothetical protein EW145_g7025 [Phellinidium pouzarii]